MLGTVARSLTQEYGPISRLLVLNKGLPTLPLDAGPQSVTKYKAEKFLGTGGTWKVFLVGRGKETFALKRAVCARNFQALVREADLLNESSSLKLPLSIAWCSHGGGRPRCRRGTHGGA